MVKDGYCYQRILRPLLIIFFLLAGITLTILPHYLRLGSKSIKHFILEGTGRYPFLKTAPDSTVLLYRLGTVLDPEFSVSILQFGLLESLNYDTAGNIRVVLGLTTPDCPYIPEIGNAVLDTLLNTPGVRTATVKIDPGLVIRR